MSVVQLLQNHGPLADAEISVLVPLDHLLRVPGQWAHYQLGPDLYFATMAAQ